MICMGSAKIYFMWVGDQDNHNIQRHLGGASPEEAAGPQAGLRLQEA